MLTDKFDRPAWNRLIDEAFALDKANPYFSQTVEEDDETPITTLGGPGSGHFGHAGRPGEVGGSAPGEGGDNYTADRVIAEQGLDPKQIDAVQERIITEAITDAEVKYSRELAVAETISRESTKNGTSKDKYADASGHYTKERQEIHHNIMRRIFEEHEEKFGQKLPTGIEHPVVTFMAGMPGAGKSTAAKDLQTNPNVITIDPDTVKRHMPEYNNGLGSNYVARESGDIADKMMEIAARQRMNIIIDGTMKTSGAPKATMGDGALGKMAEFKERGYRVEVRFVDVDLKESITNTVTRFHQEFQQKGFGRYVPLQFSRDLADPTHGTKPRLSFEMATNTSYRDRPLVDAFTHRRGWTGDPKTSNHIINSRGTLTPGGGKGE